MFECKNLEAAASAEGINYFVLCNEGENPRPFGIMASEKSSPDESYQVENIFFTREEADRCCLWLADNQVIPITLSEVLDNFYRI